MQRLHTERYGKTQSNNVTSKLGQNVAFCGDWRGKNFYILQLDPYITNKSAAKHRTRDWSLMHDVPTFTFHTIRDRRHFSSDDSNQFRLITAWLSFDEGNVIATALPSRGRLITVICFLPARRYAIAGLCDSDVSDRPSVCPSVTRRYCD